MFQFGAQAQSINTKFGKNRVQYHDDFDKWDRYETENFVTYWYGKSRNIAHASIQLAELDHDDIQRIVEHKLNEKLELIIYTDLTDIKQSNIGNEEAFHNANNQTKIVGNKMFIYFDGDHNHLRKQIREGIAAIYIQSLVYGGNIQQQVQNSLLLKLPPWYSKGLISYCGEFWNPEVENQLRDVLGNQPYKYRRFDKLAADYPELAGHSFWYYMDQMYGKSTIANLIYLSRINRNLEESFYYIIGSEFEQVKLDWSEYFFDGLNISQVEKENKDNYIPIKNKRNYSITNVVMSPQGDSMVYILNDKGKYFVYLYDFKSKQSKKIFKGGTKNIFQETDYSYPLVSWHPSKPEISILYERRDIKYLRALELNSKGYKEQSIPGNFQRIYSFDYLTEDTYVFNASEDGYSDIYTYSVVGRSNTRLTRDYHDDLDISVATYRGEKGVLFSSTRTTNALLKEELDTILPIGNFDLYFLSIEDPKNLFLTQLTATPEISERNPLMLKDNVVSYLSNHTGTTQRFILDGDMSYLNSKKQRGIVHHAVNADGGKYAYTYTLNQKNRIAQEAIKLNNKFKSSGNNKPGQEAEFIPIFKFEDDFPEGMKFQSEYEDAEESSNTDILEEDATSGFEKYFSNYFSESIQDGKRIVKFVPMRASAAMLRFKWFDIEFRADNEILFEGLESYTDIDNSLTGQPISARFSTKVKDLFEDYEVEAGIRIPGTFNGSEVFMYFDNNKHLFDHRFAFYRKTNTTVEDGTFFPITRYRSNAHLGLYRIKYPFDVYRSLSLTTTLRFDRLFFLTSDAATLNAPADREKRLSAKIEYIFDNSYESFVNIYKGTRYKFYAEAINQFDLSVTDGFEFDASNGFTSIFGFDARYYYPIYKNTILAFRGAGAASFGNKKMLYYLGGTEGALIRKFDQSIPVPSDSEYAYKVLAPNLRGFDNNIRNGDKYLLTNIELRVPILSTIGLDNIKVTFLRNLQVVGFLDGGLAWHGASPFADGNPINNATLERPPTIIVNVQYFRDPLVMGYGFGFRSTILGYFMKLDFAWGIETREIQDRKVYFSLGKDF